MKSSALRRAARHAISFTPPPAGITPIDASARPMGLFGAATTRVQCISTSQPPETATPRVTAMVGTRAWRNASIVCW